MMKDKKTIKLNKTIVLLSIAFFTFFIPSSYAVPNLIYNTWRISYTAISFVSIILILSLLIRGKISKGYITLIFYFLWIFIIAPLLADSSDLKPYQFVKAIGLVSLLEYSLIKINKRKVIESFLVAGYSISLIHFYSYLKYRNVVGGMRAGEISIRGGKIIRQNYYFLTYDNLSLFYFLPIIALSFYYAIYYNKKHLKFSVLYLAFILFMFLEKNAATAIIASAVILVGLIYILFTEQNKKNYNMIAIFKPKISILVGLLLNYLPLILVNGDIASWIANIFGKSATFSGRTDVWESSLYFISQNWVLGMGFQTTENMIQLIGISHCHNFILENLFIGGFIGLGLLLMTMFFYSPKENSKAGIVLFSTAILSYFVTASMDWSANNPIPLVLFICNYHLNISNE